MEMRVHKIRLHKNAKGDHRHMASRYNQLTMLYIFNILKLDASPKKPYSAPMVYRRLKELGTGSVCRKRKSRKTVFYIII